jgi:hypothetical protein
MKSMLVMFVVTKKDGSLTPRSSSMRAALPGVPPVQLWETSRQLYSGQNSRSSCCRYGLQPLVIYVVVTTQQSNTSLEGLWSASDKLQPEHTLATNATNANEIP